MIDFRFKCLPKKLRRLILLVAALAPCAAVATPEPDPARALHDYFMQCHAAKVCNGSFLVVDHGKVVYEAALGAASSENAGKLTPAHAFDIGSISKQFTAAAIVRLAEQDKLDLDSAAVHYLPDLPYPEVTVRQMLTHTAGLPDVMPHYTQLLRSGKATGPIQGADAIDVMARQALPLRFAPGSRFEYSNTGYLLLAQMVARVSRVEFAEFLQAQLFTPLHMTHTHLRVPGNDSDIVPRAYGFVVGGDGRKRAMDQIPAFYMVGAGGIYSTARDLQIWAQALQHGKVMSPASWREATTPVRLQDGSMVPYGFGLGLRPSALGQPRIAHSGHWRAFKSDLSLLPAQDVQIVLLTNNGEDDSVDNARDAVEAILAGKPAPVVNLSIHWPLRERLQRDDAAALKAWLENERAAKPARYDFPEDKLNDIGYELLESRDMDKAIMIFVFNRDTHPASMNALDSLADAYLANGDRQAAVAQARRMLEIMPNSKPAQEKLRALEKGD